MISRTGNGGAQDQRPIFFNGRFLSQPVTGVQRYAREVLAALGEAYDGCRPLVLLVPPGCRAPQFKKIQVQEVGSQQGHIWEQIDLYIASREGTLISLCGSGPLLHRRQLVVIHDVTLYRMPHTFKRSYILLHRLLDFALSKTAKISTVSQFSAAEIREVLGVSGEIVVAGNSAEHMLRVVPDESALDRRGLQPFNYFVLLGSVKANKNIEVVQEAINLLGDSAPTILVIGNRDLAAFSSSGYDSGNSDALKFLFTGAISDSEVVALLRNSAALVFPSLYEGFGIPALEAMQVGCPVLAADIEVMHEVCGSAARYFSPRDPLQLATLLVETAQAPRRERDVWVERGGAQAELFSWEKSAMKLLGAAEMI